MNAYLNWCVWILFIWQDGPSTNDNVAAAVRRILYRDTDLTVPHPLALSNCVLGVIMKVSYR